MAIDIKEIAEKLNNKGANKPCHRCGKNSFTILEGFSNIHLQEDFSANLVIGGPAIPLIHVICKNCGSVTPHALGALDMLPNEKATDGK